MLKLNDKFDKNPPEPSSVEPRFARAHGPIWLPVLLPPARAENRTALALLACRRRRRAVRRIEMPIEGADGRSGDTCSGHSIGAVVMAAAAAAAATAVDFAHGSHAHRLRVRPANSFKRQRSTRCTRPRWRRQHTA